MPELPEMQALAERLEDTLRGATLDAAIQLQFAALKTYAPPPETVIGRALSSTGRRGKYLLLNFDGPRIAMHLSQGGRMDVESPPKVTKPKGSLARFRFDNGTALLLKEFGTERKAGWWVLNADDEGPMAGLGPEPDDQAFARLIREGDDTRRVHTMFRDQRTVAGIGRGYTDDILHRAQISPYASLASLDATQRERLLSATAEILAEALAGERSRTGGLPPKLGDRFIMHNRAGTPCPRCGEDIRRVSYESHEVCYCPTCQTSGKILADRRMSRLIK
jgi:formamidopyrimidine-DNA glycosylase